MARPNTPRSNAPLSNGAAPADVVVYSIGAGSKTARDALAREEPLEIRVRGRSVAVTMRTPGHDRELAAGFLLTEGMVRSAEDVVEIAPCLEGDAPENTLNVFLAPGVEVDFSQLTRHVFASSSCGLCGKASIEAVHQHFPPLRAPGSSRREEALIKRGVSSQSFLTSAAAPETRGLLMPAALLANLPTRMRAAQRTFARTGGLHAAAVFDDR